MPVREPIPLATGAKQTARLCSRLHTRSDQVLQVFCTGAPAITSFVELRTTLGLDSNTNDIYRGYALTSHSTALVSRSVSAINPRIIFVKPRSETEELVSLAFARGEQFAEIVVRSRQDDLQFYLLTFSQDCNGAPGGCAPGDLLTEAAEVGWQDVNVYAEEDLENTPRDCRVCHQPEGPGTPKLLRMQEFDAPWNHWFWRQAIGGRAVLDDYYAAKGNEPFAGVPGESIVTSQPGLLNYALFSVDSPDQPNAFVSSQIEQEVMQSANAMGGDQPTDNSVPGQSATWNAIYEHAKRGEAISVPYHDVKITDGQKLATMTQAYLDYREGRLDRDQLPDIRDVYPDDEQLRAQIGLTTEPGLNGKGVLLQACAGCHNDRLDQGLSRARFGVDLSKLDRAEKARAIARLLLPKSNPSAMPPAHARTLSDEGRSRLIALLQR
jgi:mono/diheme cytochrome c family protein